MKYPAALISRISTGLVVGAVVLGVGQFAFASAAEAKDWKPRKTMTMIVASRVGGAYDVIARAMEPLWKKHFGVSLIVKNIAGAGGSLGLDRIAKAKPDGHTIGFSSRSPYLGELLKQSFPWNPNNLPILLAGETPPYVIVTNTKSGYKTWGDVRKSKRPVKLGIATQVTTEIVVIKDLVDHKAKVITGAGMGTRAVITQLLAGDLDLWVVVSSATFGDQYKAGLVKPLFVLDTKQPRHIKKKIPNLIDLGMPKNWRNAAAVRMWYAPLGTPEHIQKALAAGLRKVVEDPKIKDWLYQKNFIHAWTTGAEARKSQKAFVKIIKDNWKLYKKYGG